MKAINVLFVEVYNLMKESISIYITESKIFFNQDVTKKFEEIENYFKKYDQNEKDNNTFKLEKIFQNDKVKENIFNLLQQYYTLLSISNLLATKSPIGISKRSGKTEINQSKNS